MEIPSQYKATIDLHLLGRRRGHFSKAALPPPVRAYYIPESRRSSFPNLYISDHCTTYYDNRSPSQPQSPYGFEEHDFFQFAPPPPPENVQNNRLCPLCFWGKKDLALGCGHQTCFDCGMNLAVCTICATRITTRIRLFEFNYRHMANTLS
uniref:RING-type domain-containing protein n=2 Tax=Kalanchoe fedtschenkoi TaxID=63787 RepID=A0A7N0UQI3_KALFE